LVVPPVDVRVKAGAADEAAAAGVEEKRVPDGLEAPNRVPAELFWTVPLPPKRLGVDD
jgi:hypothetical protein